MKFDRKLIIIIAVAVIVLVLGAYLLYRAGKKSKQDASKVPPPKDNVGAGNITDEKYNEIVALATNLYNDMDGTNISWTDSLYEKASELSNEELAVLNNVFNEKYEAESEETFVQWLQGEMFWYWSPFLAQKVTVLISRLTEIGAS